MTDHHPPPPPAARAELGRRRIGLHLVALIGLAMLAAPHVVLHDLGIVHEGTAVNALLVFLPPVAWLRPSGKML